MSGHQVQTQDADIDIGKLFSAIWRDKLRILFLSLLITAMVFGLLSLVSPKYTADTRVLINENESVYTLPTTENQPANTPIIDQESIASQVEIIRSSELLLKTANELKLQNHPEFAKSSSVSFFKEVLIAFGLIENPSEMAEDQRILKEIRERLEVYPADPARVVVIQFESTDPELAAQFSNTLAKLYVSLESQAKIENTNSAAEFLSNEIAQLQTGLREAEGRVADFRAASGLFESDNNETLSTQQLAQISTELSRVRTERSSVEARVQSVEAALRSGAALDTLPDVIASPLIERLSEQQVQLNAQIADLSTTLLNNHPRIKALRSQLDGLNSQVRSQAQKVLQGLRNEVEINRDREQDLTRELNELKAETSSAGSDEVELRALEREAASQRALLESYLIRFREAQSRGEENYAPANAKIIASALAPIEATFPKMIPLLGATFFGSLLLMMLVTLMRELFSGRAMVAAPQPTQQMPIENETPAILEVQQEAKNVTPPKVDQPAMNQDKTSASNDNYSVAKLTHDLIKKGAGRAIIVSPEGDAGSMCSVGLVRNLADEGLRAVLVDLTGTGASSQYMLADFSMPGITDLLASEASYSDVIHADAASNAHIIPTGNADSDRAMRGIDRLPIIMDALSAAYDIMVMDCGPTDASGLKRLSSEDAEIILAMVEPNSRAIYSAAEDLMVGGYEDILVVTADTIDAPIPPHRGKHHAVR